MIPEGWSKTEKKSEGKKREEFADKAFRAAEFTDLRKIIIKDMFAKAFRVFTGKSVSHKKKILE